MCYILIAVKAAITLHTYRFNCTFFGILCHTLLFTNVLYCLLFASTFEQGSESEIYSHDVHLGMLIMLWVFSSVLLARTVQEFQLEDEHTRSFSVYRARAATCRVKQ